jgi:predicted  nucleic acid-binding Zn-ribbon protein
MTSLESEITSTRSELEALRASSQLASSDATAAAAVEHEALLQARADLEAIGLETSALKSAHTAALDELRQRLSVAEEKAKEVERLEAELAGLKSEKEETANRISELEIEVLEAKEAVEEAEDAKSRAESRTKGLEDELTKAKVTFEGALEDKEKNLLAQLDEAKEEHGAHAAELQQEHDNLLSQLATLEGELANARTAVEKASQEQELVAEEHAAKLQSLEQSNQAALDALSAELRRIKNELEVAIWSHFPLSVLTNGLGPRRDPGRKGQGCRGRTRTAAARSVPGGQREPFSFLKFSLMLTTRSPGYARCRPPGSSR